VKKAYEKAHKAGVKSPVIASTQPEFRALFADPALHATEEEAVIHDGSKRFFKLATHEMQRVLIVDASPLTLKLFRNHILCMFPMAHVDTAISGKDALDKIEVDSKRRCLNYDVMIVEERLPGGSVTEELLTGSELLRLVNEMESSISESSISSCGKPTRQSLKIGVSVSLGEDCESLRNIGGADLFWSKPLPKPSNGLRNQLMNALLTKRGKSVFICGS
jgi:CheY-like chemotaxis protein